MSVSPPRPVPAVLVGLLIDLVDLSMAGPLGIVGAFLAGTLVWWLAGQHGLGGAARAALTAAAAVYCLLPLTELVPLGTAVGATLTLAAARRGRGRGGRDEPPTVV
jgi:hypothetical protein